PVAAALDREAGAARRVGGGTSGPPRAAGIAGRMRIALATDAWSPPPNGVARPLWVTVAELESAGHVVEVIDPTAFRTVPCPTYPEIRLAILPYRQLKRRVGRFWPGAA